MQRANQLLLTENPTRAVAAFVDLHEQYTVHSARSSLRVDFMGHYVLSWVQICPPYLCIRLQRPSAPLPTSSFSVRQSHPRNRRVCRRSMIDSDSNSSGRINGGSSRLPPRPPAFVRRPVPPVAPYDMARVRSPHPTRVVVSLSTAVSFNFSRSLHCTPFQAPSISQTHHCSPSQSLSISPLRSLSIVLPHPSNRVETLPHNELC